MWANAHATRGSISLISYAGCFGLSLNVIILFYELLCTKRFYILLIIFFSVRDADLLCYSLYVRFSSYFLFSHMYDWYVKLINWFLTLTATRLFGREPEKKMASITLCRDVECAGAACTWKSVLHWWPWCLVSALCVLNEMKWNKWSIERARFVR